MTPPETHARPARRNARFVAMPAVWDGITAKLDAEAGFKTAFLSGSCVAASRLGGPDLDLISFGEMFDSFTMVRRAAPDLLVLADGDHGYGNAMNVQRTVRAYGRAGAAAILIEDKITPRALTAAGKPCIPREEARMKIRAAVEAAKDSGILILARTDCRPTAGHRRGAGPHRDVCRGRRRHPVPRQPAERRGNPPRRRRGQGQALLRRALPGRRPRDAEPGAGRRSSASRSAPSRPACSRPPWRHEGGAGGDRGRGSRRPRWRCRRPSSATRSATAPTTPRRSPSSSADDRHALRRHSTRAPEMRTSSATRGISAAKKAANSSGVLPTGS
jgi:hypothetical protein